MGGWEDFEGCSVSVVTSEAHGNSEIPLTTPQPAGCESRYLVGCVREAARGCPVPGGQEYLRAFGQSFSCKVTVSLPFALRLLSCTCRDYMREISYQV